MLRPFLALAACAALAGSARADSGVATYALVVGSNAAGPGQIELHYAEDDARRVGALLGELGGYAPASIDIVVHPTPAILRDRLAKLEQRVIADVAAGRQARIFFYYSGHARSTAIDLGTESMPLDELRKRLFAVPATLTVVVLDACQSGAFSRVKGASPTADFSFNSRQQLDATGVAVLASSSGSELSQESEQLRGSYFTHHLLVGMRGAGDANNDGQVSVDEAYRYAYHQTLLATAATAVGGQHVTLEVDLKGHGEVPLSFPRAASAAIVLPAQLEGHALVNDKRSKSVIAETHKSKGAAVRIAVAPGQYEVLVRQGDRMLRCPVSAPGAVDPARCTSEAVVVAVRKGGGFFRPTMVELGFFVGGERGDAFTDRLEDFGFEEDGLFAVSAGLTLTGMRHLTPKIWVGGALQNSSAPTWSRPTDGDREPLRFSMGLSTAMAVARGVQNVDKDGRLSLYGQIGAGLGMGRTKFLDQDDVETKETFFGPAFSVGAGIRFGNPELSRVGIVLGYELLYAPVIDNLTGDTHASGGSRTTLGMSFSY